MACYRGAGTAGAEPCTDLKQPGEGRGRARMWRPAITRPREPEPGNSQPERVKHPDITQSEPEGLEG